MADTKVKVGELVESSRYPTKDAIHVAVATVKAGQELRPGMPVEVKSTADDYNGGNTYAIAYATTQEASHGVVDPYLVGPIRDGEVFWLFLKPGTVENLAHTWTHKAFGSEYGTQNEEVYNECRGC